MKALSKTDALQKIQEYFSKDNLDAGQTKKIKKLAMAHRIRLGDYRKRFCKKCYYDLKTGKVSISKEYKKVLCLNCGKRNGWKIK